MKVEMKHQAKMEQRASTSLVMTHWQRQAIELLLKPRQELEVVVNSELECNPVLEESGQSIEDDELPNPESDGAVEASSHNEHDQTLSDIDIDPYFTEESETWEDETPTSKWEDDQKHPLENFLTLEENLSDYLLSQLHMLNITPEQRKLAEYIIGNLNSDGFLIVTCEEIQNMDRDGFDSKGHRTEGAGTGPIYSPEAVDEALELVRNLDPPGIACRTLQESLLRQLDHRGEREGSLVYRMVSEKCDDLIHRRFQTIAKSFGVPLADLQPAFMTISTLNFRPGRQYNHERTHFVEPDVYVMKVDGKYIVQLNDDGLPRLRISRAYSRMLKKFKLQGSEGEAQRFIKEKMRSAIELIKSLDYRQRTIFKVATSIVQYQREFLDNGIDYLRPMVLRDVADHIDMHESTVSRIVSNKYINTPRGLLTLKFFFHSGIDREDG